MDYSSLIDKRRLRFAGLEEAIGDPNLFDNPKRATEILREHRNLKSTLDHSYSNDETNPPLSDKEEQSKSAEPDYA